MSAGDLVVAGCTALPRRLALLALTLAAAAALSLPATARAIPVPLGDNAPEHSTDSPFGACSGGAGANLVQPQSQFPYTYTVSGPSAAVITMWNTAGPLGATDAGRGRLLVWRPTSNPRKFELVGKSQTERFEPPGGDRFFTRIPAQPGDVIGLRAESDEVSCWHSHQADGYRSYNGPDPEVGSVQTFGPEQAGRNVNVEAYMEPDPDADGFSDESQDFCPGNPGPDDGCPLEPPIAGETANAIVTGTVRVRLPGSDEFVTIDDAASVPVGTLFDTRKGEVRLDSRTRTGSIRTAFLSEGTFKFLQDQADGFITELKLTPISRGTRRAGRAVPPINELLAKAGRGWGGKGKGKGHQTTGNHGSGSVRGTEWLTSEVRAGTRFDVFEGQVRVRDFELDRTVIVRAGESYLARAD